MEVHTLPDLWCGDCDYLQTVPPLLADGASLGTAKDVFIIIKEMMESGDKGMAFYMITYGEFEIKKAYIGRTEEEVIERAREMIDQ